jgi:methylated-DNA-[protein]-cysteine S-methyltransferase
MLSMNKTWAPMVPVTHTTIPSKLGDLTVVDRNSTVVGLYFPHHWYRSDPASFGLRNDAGFENVRDQIGEHLAGERQEFEVPIATEGAQRQERVWELVRQIPYGENTTYGDLARRLGDNTTPQEVGAAVGRNPVCLLVPCHRVVGADGTLTGYAGGLSRKRFLLDLEADVVALQRHRRHRTLRRSSARAGCRNHVDSGRTRPGADRRWRWRSAG